LSQNGKGLKGLPIESDKVHVRALRPLWVDGRIEVVLGGSRFQLGEVVFIGTC